MGPGGWLAQTAMWEAEDEGQEAPICGHPRSSLVALPTPSGVDGRCRGGRTWFAGLLGWAGWDQHQLGRLRALVSSPAGLSRPFRGPPSSQQPPPSSTLPPRASRAAGTPPSAPDSASRGPSDPLGRRLCPLHPMPALSTPFFVPLQQTGPSCQRSPCPPLPAQPSETAGTSSMPLPTFCLSLTPSLTRSPSGLTAA